MSETALAEVRSIGAKRLTERLAERFGVDQDKMIHALKQTAFRTRDPISNEQMMALCIVAEQYDLNPWTKEIYAFPDPRGGIVPVVGIDGWSRIINSHPQFDGMTFEYSAEVTANEEHKPCHEWVKCIIHRKDRDHPIAVTEYLDECYRPPFAGRNGPTIGPWQTHTKRFLRHKAMIQCARIAFGFVGIYDQDEGERIIEAEVIREESKPIAARKAALDGIDVDEVKVAEYVDALREAMPSKESIDEGATMQLHDELKAQGDLYIAVADKLESWQRTAIRKLAKQAKEQDDEIRPETVA